MQVSAQWPPLHAGWALAPPEHGVSAKLDLVQTPAWHEAGES